MVELSVVVATYERAGELDACLRSLEAQTVRPSAFEVIVCDDGSTDNTFLIVRQHSANLNLRYCFQPDRGFQLARSRNMGVALASGDIVLFLDADALAAPGLVEAHLAAHAAYPCDQVEPGNVLTGPFYGYGIRPDDARQFLDRNRDRWWVCASRSEAVRDIRADVLTEYEGEPGGPPEPWTLLMGNNFSVRRDLLRRVGGFDEAFIGWGAEDTDLALRLYRAGARFAFDERAATFHQPRRHDDAVGKTFARNRTRIYRKLPCLETELLPFYQTARLGPKVVQVRDLVKRNLTPSYVNDTPLLSLVRDVVLEPSLVVGACAGVVEAVAPAAVSDPDEAKLVALPGNSQRICRIGAMVADPSQCFTTAIVTDLWRVFDAPVSVALLARTASIADRTFLLFTPGHEVASAPGLATQATPRRLRVLLARAGEVGCLEPQGGDGMDLVAVGAGSHTEVYELVRTLACEEP